MEIAFGRLKARWRRLSKQIDMDIENVPHVIAACCVLHNLCEVHGDSFNEEWLEESDVLDQPENDVNSQVHSGAGSDLRTVLMNYFNQD